MGWDCERLINSKNFKCYYKQYWLKFADKNYYFTFYSIAKWKKIANHPNLFNTKIKRMVSNKKEYSIYQTKIKKA